MNTIPAEQICKIKEHLAKTGKTPRGKDRPRIFAAVHHVNWERYGLVDGWSGIADVIHYDWGTAFNQYAPDWHQVGKPAFNKKLLRHVESTHHENPIDVFFAYLSGRWVYPETIRTIGNMGLITINISLDDTATFWGLQEPGGLSGNAEIAPEFDLSITCQSSQDVLKYDSAGARALFLPPGANPDAFSPLPLPRDIPVSFIGQCYGARPQIIAWLREQGIEVQAFGKGWPSGELPFSDMAAIYSRSTVNLGFGFIQNSFQTGVKGRDFEVPLMGGLYLTTYNHDLAECFNLGAEIDCYRNETELLSKLYYYSAHPDVALKIGAEGRDRCLRSHTWSSRFKTVLQVAGLSVSGDFSV
jgi:hypothetical protein